MAEIDALPPNGYSVASLFSGGGGSSLGYRMAGFRVVYANEFVPAAQETYRANCSAFLDTRDIREVSPESVLRSMGIRKGDLDVLDGSPPCCAFSLSGKREKGWGKQRDYSDDKEQRVDDLFFEYARLLQGIQPKVFVAENVAGLVVGKAKGYFKLILQRLKSCGYVVEAAILDASRLGVPQARRRVIFVGVRNDICEKFGVSPVFPKPSPFQFTLRDALDGVRNDPREVAALLAEGRKYAWGRVLRRIPKNPARNILGKEVTKRSYFNLIRSCLCKPAPTIIQTCGNPSAAGVVHPTEDRKFTIAEVRRIMSVPDDFVLTGTREQKFERLGRMVPPLMMKRIAETIEKQILDKVAEHGA